MTGLAQLQAQGTACLMVGDGLMIRLPGAGACFCSPPSSALDAFRAMRA